MSESQVHRRARGARRAWVPLLAVSALALNACNSSGTPSQAGPSADNWDATVAAAASEGKIVIALSTGPGYEKFAQVVREAMAPYLDEVEVTTIAGSDLAARVVSEQAAGQFLWDIHLGGAANLDATVRPANGLQSIVPFLDALPDDVKQDEDWGGGFELYTTDGPDPTSFVFSIDKKTDVAVNHDVIAEEITTPEDLLDPRWRGKIVMYEPTAPNNTSQALTYFQARPEYGEQYIRTLLEDRDTVYVSSVAQASQWLAEGRAGIGFGVDRTHISEYQAQGIGTNIEYLNIGTYYLVRAATIFKNAPHPNAIAVFLHWFLSQEGQEAWKEYTSDTASSRRLDVGAKVPELAPDYDDLESAKPFMGTPDGTKLLQEVVQIANDSLK